ncbi:phosphotransferase enzyme family protein [Reinekea sp.]|jgi:Ser/Thr protein kinase RdoA (MazF antagonist)|uniref:phosphotransferase enzyme family protein n=1 Tax=Reinekea sp. TaxID=1970455 RepID=UPI002A80BFBB|nr:phosphotransferase [Reinekea sp.]
MAGEPVQRRLQYVLEHFDKRPIDNVILNYFSLANEVYTITTRDGKFVVKNCFKNNSRELVANEAGLIQFLNDHEVPCPKLIPTRTGALFLEYDGQFYIMNEFVDGWVPKWHDKLSAKLMSETMHAMADFHRVTEHFKPPFEPHRMAALAIPEAVHWLNNLLPSLIQDRSGRQSVALMLNIVAELLPQGETLQAKLEKVDLSVLKKVFIHGDLHCFNLIFSADDEHYKAILDFDFIREDYRLVDFFWATRSMIKNYWIEQLFGFSPRSNEHLVSDAQLQAATSRAVAFMIDCYRNHHSLPDAEIRLLPLFAEALPFYTVRFFKLSNSEEECLDHASWFRRQLDDMKQTLRHLEVAVEQFLVRD